MTKSFRNYRDDWQSEQSDFRDNWQSSRLEQELTDFELLNGLGLNRELEAYNRKADQQRQAETE